MSSTDFDASRARLADPDMFPRFRVSGATGPVSALKLRGEEQLLIARRGDARLAFLKRQMAYHHLAQGELDLQPYVVAF